MKKWILTVSILLLALFLSACGNDSAEEESSTTGDTQEPFTIGVIPAQTEGEMQTAMDKLQTILAEELDREVEIEVYPDYNGVVESMNYDQIDMAYLGPLTYVIAEANSNAKAIITQLVDGEPFYNAYIITHTDNPVASLDELLENPGEVQFAFGDPNSTSGSLIPSIELQDRGVYESEQENEFETVRFTGSHDATALAVQNKQVDAGAIDSAIYNQLLESGKIDEDQLKIIWESEPLFQYPWAVLESTDDETVAKLREAFLAIEDPEILDAFGATGFTEADNADYESIKQAAIKQGIIEE
ncbi:phosphate/phosphite/phosphonate ABC transporter substrate-binding protein [Microbacterium sp. APC 3898]|uniref:Phosphate/phosphite/phosphonate ABC transporter substrate-binding protein n=1 Tax=Planococcus notacanthi TaxID=3035188 RepID=A0ABT7ZNY0_9BACL|nr:MULTISPECIES: phosphate/phosphite/phosphonate ABC transporter substrate-binding protein [Terrabacteria group]MDN3428367.1 phosphate/phosphite/phosphonate ABC transporter substrate-binding protein [Planococcus sp. APC 4016]MDN3498926.1 phosphate/phosphite/phosphonate ABC transporter substrate-binding protein [Microbacterium sp. APC 3898]